MLADNIFLKIINKQIPAKIIHDDDVCLAFHDANPQAPVHVLIIPRKVIATHDDLTPADKELVGHLHLVARSGTAIGIGGRVSCGRQLQGARRSDRTASPHAFDGGPTVQLAAGIVARRTKGKPSSLVNCRSVRELSARCGLRALRAPGAPFLRRVGARRRRQRGRADDRRPFDFDLPARFLVVGETPRRSLIRPCRSACT